MTDSFQETKKITYWENIKNSFSGMLAGLVLFLASFVVLWMNEGHSVSQINKAKFMNKAAIEVEANQIDRANDGKLIHVSGNATTNEKLTDEIISVPNAFVLKRKAEMYQWSEKTKKETKDELGGGTTETTTYSYEKVWSSHPIDSSNFRKTSYHNPSFDMESVSVYAKTGKLGDYKLTEKQSQSMGDLSEYTELPANPNYKVYENMYYKGYNPQNPQIGDIRISYQYVPSGVDISIIAQQKSDNTLTSMLNKGKSVYLQQSGIKTKDEMITKFKQDNVLLTNIIRFLGWFLMFTGMNMLLNPLVVIFKVVPFVARVVGFLSKGVVMLITLALSLLTIAIAWFAYRPFLSIFLIALIAGVVFGVKKLIEQQKKSDSNVSTENAPVETQV